MHSDGNEERKQLAKEKEVERGVNHKQDLQKCLLLVGEVAYKRVLEATGWQGSRREIILSWD